MLGTSSVMDILTLLLFASKINLVLMNEEKENFCRDLVCEESDKAVCGIKEGRGQGGGEGLKLRLFKNECEMLKYGCTVDDEEEYGLINMENCEQTLSNSTSSTVEKTENQSCVPEDCDTSPVCAIREHENGFKVRLFNSKCSMLQYNCENKLDFSVNDSYLCRDMQMEAAETVKTNQSVLVVVDASMFYNDNINNTVDNFFVATHHVNMPLQQVDESEVNETTRRRLIKTIGPVVIYKPWIKVPKVIPDDIYHDPLLRSCYHKCPTECPDTYAPVCGNPGSIAREPSVMFQNHCYMDMAQCKMKWENVGPTAASSAYIEAVFLFCVGEQLAHMYLMMPIVRTLQRMGRLRRKGRFRQRLRNLRYVNAATRVMG